MYGPKNGCVWAARCGRLSARFSALMVGTRGCARLRPRHSNWMYIRWGNENKTYWRCLGMLVWWNGGADFDTKMEIFYCWNC